jgi:hypothetical protein
VSLRLTSSAANATETALQGDALRVLVRLSMVLKVRTRQESLGEPAAARAGPRNAEPTYIVDADKVQSSRLKDLWAYRELFLLLVKRDFVAVYKQTVLGPLWFFVQPFLASVVYMVVFGQIALRPVY